MVMQEMSDGAVSAIGVTEKFAEGTNCDVESSEVDQIARDKRTRAMSQGTPSQREDGEESNCYIPGT